MIIYMLLQPILGICVSLNIIYQYCTLLLPILYIHISAVGLHYIHALDVA
jgi:hypothetical protein